MPETEKLEKAPHREQLIYLLTEASELEHGLMCSYLFAGFSLRRRGEEIDEEEAVAIDGWRKSIRSVAVEEMLHLGLVQNLLTAIGGAPHLQRPNFPVSAGLYPSGLALQLRRFDEATLDHFVYLERPDGLDLADGEGFEPQKEYVRSTPRSFESLTASAQEYSSVAALYRGIEEGLRSVSREIGEKLLFLGDPRGQVSNDLFALDGLTPVTDLASACAAVERIVEQGEGSRKTHETSHFERFVKMREEHARLRKRRPSFEAARRVAANLVMNVPVDDQTRTHVDADEAARLLDLGNASYGLMVQLLARFFSAVDTEAGRRVLAGAAQVLMSKAIAPVAEALTKLPATREPGSENAGLTFTLPRSTHALPQLLAAWSVLHERASQIADGARACVSVADMSEVSVSVSRVADDLERYRDAVLRTRASQP